TTVTGTLAANMTSANWGPPTDSQTGALSPLANNGVQDRLTFVNTGSSGTPFIMRVTNEGILSGRVTIDVWQEDGTAAPNSPVDLAGVTLLTGALVSGELAAGSSVIFTASALAAAAGLTDADTMRVRTIGEFTNPGGGGAQGIRIQGWSISNPTTGASFGQTLN
ncbi:MAG: hypothetical protein KKC37_07685, partial [Proteobacteria bacterium]|nr:hypothetical protein [Pseudomonadota bacterium]